MSKYIAILGRQHEISIAELISLYGDDVLEHSDNVAILSTEPDLSRIGGSIKIAQVLDTASNSTWQKALSSAAESAIKKRQVSGKLSIGCSVYGERARPKDIGATLIDIKKSAKASGQSVRTIPNRQQTLNAAQIYHNKLLGNKGMELVVIRHNNQHIVAVTTQTQDIDAYTARDRNKPVRDARNGMLPPKLAQIMLNLAQTSTEDTILDPFCGTGTVLIEALRNGSSVVGSDLETDMVEAATKNVAWFTEAHPENKSATIYQADAQTHHWPEAITAVVGETYLGPPLKHLPSHEKLSSIIASVNKLHENTLKNLADLLPKGSYVCLAIPAWRTKQQMKRLPVVDDLEQLGYNRLDLIQENKPLLYFRPDAIVARELLVLRRN